DGKLRPYLADSWEVTPTSITFKLRKDATCSDGTPVTPTVVRNSFQRMIDVKSPYRATLWGPGPYSVAADDAAGTFTFTVGTPFSTLVWGFSDTFPGVTTGIVCPAGLADPTQLKTKMFGAGAYTVAEAV